MRDLKLELIEAVSNGDITRAREIKNIINKKMDETTIDLSKVTENEFLAMMNDKENFHADVNGAYYKRKRFRASSIQEVPTLVLFYLCGYTELNTL